MVSGSRSVLHDRIARLGIGAGALYLMVLPFGHAAALRSLTLALALAAALAVWAGNGFRRPPLLGTFAVWLAAALLSLPGSHDQEASLEAIDSDIFRSFIVFFTFFVLTRHRAAFPAWVGATVLGALALSGLGIATFIRHDEWTSHVLPSLGDFATGALTVLPLLAGYRLLAPCGDERNRLLEWLALVAIAGILVAGFLTHSRAFWLVLAGGAALAFALHLGRVRRIAPRMLLAMVLLCVAAAALSALVAAQRGRTLADFSDRAPIYSQVIGKVLASPLQGTGYGHETDREWYRAAMPADSSIFHAHNIVLSFADQMGVFGLLALAAIFGGPARLLARAYRSDQPRASGLGTCGMVLLAAVFVKNNLDYFFLNQNLWLFFAHIGIYLGETGRLDDTAGNDAHG